MSIKSFEKVFMLVAVAILLVSSAFSSVGAAQAEGPMFEKGTSNVSQKEFNQIRNTLKKTDEYQVYKKISKINAISTDNIIINTVPGSKGDIAYVEFIFDELAEQSENLAYVQFTYDVANRDVITDQALFAKQMDGDNINIQAVFNLDGKQTEVYNVTVDNEGGLWDQDGLEVSHEDFVANAEKNIKGASQNASENGNEFVAYASFCEYAVGALCGTGGGVACYALAGALGITTGLGGLGLAAICALVGSVGCTAATDQICN
ncbi:halocin C8 precursor-like protein [Planococcus plakortidis]|uniref:halocin C8 precursor-like protein n=1 Tax=Planococcus plakortidis TaxID=1038856 RepID=UPI00385D057B